MKNRTSKKKKHKLRKWVIITPIVLLVIIASFLAVQYYSFQNALSKMNEPEEGKQAIQEVDKKLMSEPFSVLLLGVDERENDAGRSDTMIVLTVNPKLSTVKMLSIPRDTRVEIVGNGTTEKINHAYARGGVQMSIDTVEQFLNIDIDYAVMVNMDGFLDVIDEVGGITIDNDMDLTFRDYHFPVGEVTLSGEEALVFSRIRYEDPRGDFGRQIRQRQMIEALMAESKNPQILLELSDIFEVLGDNIKTNFTMKQIYSLPQLYVQLDKDIEQISFEQGEGQMIDSLWYYIPNEEERLSISTELRQHLELSVVEESLYDTYNSSHDYYGIEEQQTDVYTDDQSNTYDENTYDTYNAQ